jgi:hypothetical protein
MNRTITQGVASNRDIKRNCEFTAVCQHCENNYVIGRTGTVEGCDKCLKISRNKLDGTIINDNIFRTYTEDEDTLTDMEKA